MDFHVLTQDEADDTTLPNLVVVLVLDFSALTCDSGMNLLIYVFV